MATVKDIYLLNTAENRDILGKLENGDIRLTGLEIKHISPEVITEKLPNIFTLL